MPRLLLLNKPFNVLSQFTGSTSSETLAPYIPHKGFYPAGRLDKDSEGLLLLTDCGVLQQQISDPRFKMSKVYLAQVEGEIDEEALQRLADGVVLKDGLTRPALARAVAMPRLWPRLPPIRERKTVPTCWIELTLREGKNRQVRRMTAAVGFPTLRLIRIKVGEWELGSLQPGEFKLESVPRDWSA
ncbi:MAG: pseudouridine synthase [Pseudohongiellaceae bacterium]